MTGHKTSSSSISISWATRSSLWFANVRIPCNKLAEGLQRSGMRTCLPVVGGAGTSTRQYSYSVRGTVWVQYRARGPTTASNVKLRSRSR